MFVFEYFFSYVEIFVLNFSNVLEEKSAIKSLPINVSYYEKGLQTDVIDGGIGDWGTN